MPATIAGLVIILFAILPGLPAYKVYRVFFGENWRATDWEKVVDIVGFSISGLIVYTILVSIFSLPPPIYVIPTTFDAGAFTASTLAPIAWSYLGHIIGSLLVSVLIVCGVRLFGRWTPSSPYPAAWDDFVRVDVEKHWVVVRLVNGEAYAGMLKYADASVSQTERDIILSEPAKFVKNENNYLVLPYQQLFLPAALIFSVAVVHDPEIDKRISQIDSYLFSKDAKDAKDVGNSKVTENNRSSFNHPTD